LLMVAPQKRGSSVGSPALEDRRNCAEKNLAIEPQGPVVDVELVELLLQLDIRIASFGYLPKAREPRRDRRPMRLCVFPEDEGVLFGRTVERAFHSRAGRRAGARLGAVWVR